MLKRDDIRGCCRCHGVTPEIRATGFSNDLYYVECQECGVKTRLSATQYGAIIFWEQLQDKAIQDEQTFWIAVENDEDFWR